MSDEIASMCESCGASIYRQHIDSGIARYEDGKLLCAHCVEEVEEKQDRAAHSEYNRPIAPVELADDDREQTSSGSRIHGFSTATLGVGAKSETKFKRSLDPASMGATRCRTFHSKLSDNAIVFMNNQVNDWIDANPDVVIKFATSTIGVFEGKHAEPNLILTLFY